MNFDNVFLVALWKFINIDELIDNRSYKLDKSITKVALSLRSQKISEKELEILENNNWNVIEVEDILEKATSTELEKYFQLYMEEMQRNNFENDITNQNSNYDLPIKTISKEEKELTIDDFLNNEEP